MAKVCDIMRQDIMRLKIDDPNLKAWRLVGVFTERRPLVHAAAKPTWWRVLFREIHRFASDYRRAFRTTVGDLMVPARISADPATSLETATALVLRLDWTYFPWSPTVR